VATKASTPTARAKTAAAGRRARAVPEVVDPKARRYDPAETRTRVLEAAYMLFNTRGYAGTGTADIAREADVSEGSIFYHFGSKRALLAELGKLHGEKMVAAMQGGDPIDSLTFAVSLTRCFDFCEVNQVWDEVVHEGEECAVGSLNHKHNKEAEPFFLAAREVVVDWTRRHMEAVAAKHGDPGHDVDLCASMIFTLVGDALHHYFAPGTTPERQGAIRREVIRFCTAAAGHPAIERP
jgi:AcrR family transcriptional regulator